MRQHPPIIPTMESQWQRAEKESFLLDIPALEERKPSVLDNKKGKLSSFPQSGRMNQQNYRGLEQELPQYIIQALRYNGEINNDEMIAKFISSEEERSINSRLEPIWTSEE
jgi:hypothetical protein